VVEDKRGKVGKKMKERKIEFSDQPRAKWGEQCGIKYEQQDGLKGFEVHRGTRGGRNKEKVWTHCVDTNSSFLSICRLTRVWGP
jgi:hypothetical protein